MSFIFVISSPLKGEDEGEGKRLMRRIKPVYTSLARKLRKDQTEVEKILWYHLRNKQIENIKFRRQYTVGSYIVDFISVERSLVIEIDGGQHNNEQIKVKDQIRTQYLEKHGYKILRFWNNEILANINEVLEIIRLETSHPHPDPLPQGRGKL